MSTHITPTVGRKVWYRPHDTERMGTKAMSVTPGEPLDATIVKVWNDQCVNLVIFDANGTQHTRMSAYLRQDEVDIPDWVTGYAEWMPYQVGQAKKAEDRAQEVLITTTDRHRMRLDDIGRVCHEVNRAYCQALGDNSQPTWEDAPVWQRESARMGVDLHMAGDFGPEASHISWMQQKLDDGWTYGPIKDPELKQHPCLVPFDQLPREQQAKDYLFRAVVHALR